MSDTDPDAPPRRRRRFVLPLVIVGVAALAVGGTLGVLALMDDEDDNAAVCDAFDAFTGTQGAEAEEATWQIADAALASDDLTLRRYGNNLATALERGTGDDEFFGTLLAIDDMCDAGWAP
jgi:hypothetical protein